MTPRAHGHPAGTDIVLALITGDKELAYTRADMDAWADRNPCDCHALCRCGEDA